MNTTQTALRTTAEATIMRKVQDSIVQAGVGFCLFCVIAIFGMVIVSQATGQERIKTKTSITQADVLPQLVLWNDALEPGFTGMLATGDGGAMIDPSKASE